MELTEKHKLLGALHQHWLAADSIRVRIPMAVKTENNKLPEGQLALAQLASLFPVLKVFYALTYVVIEGYEVEKLSDKTIDALLKDADKLQMLRKFRNGTFHYQKDPLTIKVWAFLLEDDTEKWLKEIHFAFKAFFEEQFVGDFMSEFAE